MKRNHLSVLLGCCIGLLLLFNACSEDEPTDLPFDCNESTLEGTFRIITEPTCTEGAEIELTGVNGFAPYAYSLDGLNFQESGVFEDLSPGTYTGYVRDSTNCIDEGVFSLTAADSGITMNATADSVAGCGGSEGQVTVIASGGVGTLTYRVDDGSFGSDSVFMGLTAGNHVFDVMDEEGCVLSSTEFVLSGTSYADEVAAILQTNCDGSTCHIGGTTGLPDWSDFSELQNKSVRVKTKILDGTMPPASSGKSLSQAEIDIIVCWVDDGAPNN